MQGVSWDLSAEYRSPDAPEVDADLAALSALLDRAQALSVSLVAVLDDPSSVMAETIEAAKALHDLTEQASVLLQNPKTYADCLLSVDSQDELAQDLAGRLQGLTKRYSEAFEPLSQFLDLVEDDVVELFLDDERTSAARFAVLHARKRRAENLGLAAENLISALANDGIHAWGRVYDQLSGTLSCEVSAGNELETMGLAQAAGRLQAPEDPVREDAWRAINAAWTRHRETCAAAINAIAGWRLELVAKRSARSPTHYIDAPVHMNRIERATLDTVMGVAEEYTPLARRAAKLMARLYGKEALGPWDVRAPAPDVGEPTPPVTYDEAIEIVRSAYAGVAPEMGDFVAMMADRRWIEGTVSDRKRPGAYCTRFAKSRTPRVYMTYTGGTSNVITLAHEVGHAYHSWVMRDLPQSQRAYGMSIAETASTFGETIVRDALLERASTPHDEMAIVWEEVAAIVTFLLNIPTRYEFERRFYEARSERPQRPDELEAMMSAAWRKWYGDAVSEPDPLFWASKLHFYISGLSFYNFPYLFGYLFSLGVHARRAALGEHFFERYRALLLDTGRMTAEDLARAHLDVDIREPAFWRDTVQALEGRVDTFEGLVDRLGR